MLKQIDDTCKAEENLIINELLASIDNRTSLLFNAGAGAGKTYALVECLKHVCREKEKILNYHNQKAVCITYTNVAANEIKERLGNTDLILVSTIHERLWDIIKEYQEELLLIHIDNLESQINDMQQEIKTDKVFSELNEEQQNEIVFQLFEKQHDFYNIYNSKADDFRKQFSSLFPNFKSKIGNVKDFSKTCSKIIRVKKYEQCIEFIKKVEKGYTEVKYDARSNKDYLHHMKISHDTLLMYSNQIISKYDELKQFIADKYPYFFIDEYQDTSEFVINILSEIVSYSTKINHKMFVGYFGDSVQNIYELGIGEKIEVYCKDYKHIYKIYNRRSCNEIISLANRIRNDNIEQKSVFTDSIGGSVKAYYGTENDIEDFINTNSGEMKELSNEEKSVHCFLLMNKIVAEHAGLGELYDWFYSTPYYKQNYDILATELLSNDVNKLGEIERYIYNITEFFLLSKIEDTPLLDIMPKELLISLDISSIGKIVGAMKAMKAISLKDILLAIETFKSNLYADLYEKKGKTTIDKAIDEISGLNNFCLYSFIEVAKQELFSNGENAEQQIELLLDLNCEMIFKWYQYINRNYDEDVIYHTFHSTKGLEYDNVIVIFGDSFGRSKSYFNDFFTEYYHTVEGDTGEKYNKARNLLYVAATRARINLRFLYTGEYQSKMTALKDIFGDISAWKNINDDF